MNVSALATEWVVTVEPGDSLDKAINLMEEHEIHHLPVVQAGRLEGILSDRDLLLAVGWMMERERRVTEGRQIVGPAKVADVMSRPVTTVSPEAPVHQAARLMVEQKIDALPIVRGGVMIAIVTKADLLRCLQEPIKWWLKREVLEEKVRDHMRANVFTVAPKESLLTAADMMRKHRIRHLPVTSQGALIGMVTDRDIRRSCGVEAIEDGRAQDAGDFYMGPTRVMEIMSRHVRTIKPSQTLLAAAREMSEHLIGALPVCDSESLAGIITDADLLSAVAAADE